MEEIKKLLLEEKATLLLGIEEKSDKKNRIVSDIGDAIDSSVEEQGRELDLLLQDRYQARLLGIEEALKRMEEDAVRMGADAVLNVRFTTSVVMQGASEILAYGTAVKLK